MKSNKSHYKTYIFIVDTRKFSGGFYGELSAYVTGYAFLEGWDHQREFSKLFEQDFKDNPFEQLINVENPCSMWSTPGYGNNGRGDYVLLDFHNKEQYPYKAYQSVAIFFYEKPSKELLKILRKRSTKFCEEIYPKYHQEKIDIIDFRLATKSITIQDIEKWDTDGGSQII